MDNQLPFNVQIKQEPEDNSYETGYDLNLKNEPEENLPENFVGIKQEMPENLSIKVEPIDHDEGVFEEGETVPEEILPEKMVMKLDPSCYSDDHYNNTGE